MVILEDIQGKLGLVLEGHDAIRKEFNDQLNDVREQQRLFMSLLKGSHEELKEEIQAVDKRSEERDAKLTAEIRAVGEKVDGHEARIATLERKVA